MLTEGLAAPMSRTMVFFAFPVFITSVNILRGIILFKRGTIADKDVSAMGMKSGIQGIWGPAATVPGVA